MKIFFLVLFTLLWQLTESKKYKIKTDLQMKKGDIYIVINPLRKELEKITVPKKNQRRLKTKI